jgi:hypothetical protein
LCFEVVGFSGAFSKRWLYVTRSISTAHPLLSSQLVLSSHDTHEDSPSCKACTKRNHLSTGRAFRPTCSCACETALVMDGMNRVMLSPIATATEQMALRESAAMTGSLESRRDRMRGCKMADAYGASLMRGNSFAIVCRMLRFVSLGVTALPAAGSSRTSDGRGPQAPASPTQTSCAQTAPVSLAQDRIATRFAWKSWAQPCTNESHTSVSDGGPCNSCMVQQSIKLLPKE